MTLDEWLAGSESLYCILYVIQKIVKKNYYKILQNHKCFTEEEALNFVSFFRNYFDLES